MPFVFRNRYGPLKGRGALSCALRTESDPHMPLQAEDRIRSSLRMTEKEMRDLSGGRRWSG
jgi:hypothetical protein